MPTWSQIAQEMNQYAQAHPGVAPFDAVRRKYLAMLQAHTGNATILYATKWTQADQHTDQTQLQVVPEDLQGLMEVMHGINSPNLDLILHSPGGSAEAAESLMIYLRSKFTGRIRVLVPHAAMSAATMMACAADELVLGKHYFSAR